MRTWLDDTLWADDLLAEGLAFEDGWILDEATFSLCHWVRRSRSSLTVSGGIGDLGKPYAEF